MVAVTGDPPEIVAAQLDQARWQTVGPIGANLFVSVADPAIVREGVAAAAERARVVDFFYADPDPTLVAIAHAGGARRACGSAAAVRARCLTARDGNPI